MRPGLEYCCTVWSPHTQEVTQKLEMVQCRASRYVNNRYRNTSIVTSMQDHLQWEPPESRRIKYRLAIIFQILHGQVDIPSDKYLTPASTRARSQHGQKFRQIQASSDYYIDSFFHATVRHWNSLSTSAVDAPTLTRLAKRRSILILTGPVVKPGLTGHYWSIGGRLLVS